LWRNVSIRCWWCIIVWNVDFIIFHQVIYSCIISSRSCFALFKSSVCNCSLSSSVFSLYTTRPTERGDQPERRPGPMTNKQVESCFLNHDSTINFCYTDSLLMTNRDGFSLSNIIWRIGRGKGGGFCPGPKNSLDGPAYNHMWNIIIVFGLLVFIKKSQSRAFWSW